MCEEADQFKDIFDNAQALLQKLFKLHDGVVGLQVNNTFSTEERIAFLQAGIELIPECVGYIERSTAALTTLRFLLQDHADVIASLKEGLQDQASGD